MRKIILFFVMALLSIGCHAQSPSVAYDHVTGTMMFDGGKDYAVVQMEGTQKELHDLIMTNLTRICNNASDNVTSFNDASVSMSAVTKLFTLDLSMGIKQQWDGKIKIDIAIKDGKVRISAPVLSEVYDSGKTFIPYGGSFKSWADWYVYKSESKQQKHGYAIDQLNANMTALVNAIVSKSDGDW